jgi:hypothetical protein
LVTSLRLPPAPGFGFDITSKPFTIRRPRWHAGSGDPLSSACQHKGHSNVDYLAETRGVVVPFLIFLIPAFPDDLVAPIAGLSRIPIRTLVLISLAGEAEIDIGIPTGAWLSQHLDVSAPRVETQEL